MPENQLSEAAPTWSVSTSSAQPSKLNAPDVVGDVNGSKTPTATAADDMNQRVPTGSDSSGESLTPMLLRSLHTD
jgi:hypothetical protein